MGGTKLRRVVAAFALAIAGAAASPRAAQPVPATAWIHGRWFDGNAFKALDVYTTGGRITLKPPTHVDRTIDLAGGYVTGAFGDAHNHNIPSDDTNRSIRTYLEQGIFYVMIQANLPRAPAELAGRINTPASVDVAFANGAFTAPGGHPTRLVKRNIAGGGMEEVDLHDGFILAAASTADVDRIWRDAIRKVRPDFIKIILVYSEDRVAGVPRPTDSDRHGLDPSLAPYIVKKAHADGLRVSAHVESAYDFDVAVDAGADIIAHFPGFWPAEERTRSRGWSIYEISDEIAAKAGRQHVTVVTTIGESLRLIETPQGAALREPLLKVYRQNFARLRRHDVRLAIGSDQFRSTSVPEALDIHKAGLLSPSELLRALSIDAAATIFPKRARFGPAEGAPADFLVFADDPLADFTAIQRISRRVKSGEPLR
jgi:imidazolonepropionase-like amidohydrolase